MTLSPSHVGIGITRYDGGYVNRCDGAWVQAKARNGAMVITLEGQINTTNVNAVTATLARFISVRTPLVLDLRKLGSLIRPGWRALVALGYWYREAGMPLILVMGPALKSYVSVVDRSSVLPVTDSLHEAMRHLDAPRRTRSRRPPIVAPQQTRC